MDTEIGIYGLKKIKPISERDAILNIFGGQVSVKKINEIIKVVNRSKNGTC